MRDMKPSTNLEPLPGRLTLDLGITFVVRLQPPLYTFFFLLAMTDMNSTRRPRDQRLSNLGKRSIEISGAVSA